MRMHRAYVQSLMAAAQTMSFNPGRPGRAPQPRNRSATRLSPCSHRETATQRPNVDLLILRSLFAQGDLLRKDLGLPGRPSTPVRTGKPGWNPYVDPLTAFDPCSHRETLEDRDSASEETLRPLFAQGDQDAAAGTQTRAPSTPVRRVTRTNATQRGGTCLPALRTGKTQTQVLSHPKLTFQPSGSTR